ncbi:MAG: RHS repeat-associated core domain-containing protein [Bacteroidaceae bacterium]|nr:RHS repeat-associated core domain-containing protein [Bacteroidaceae bacterium]
MYTFNITDHLGNVRAVVSLDGRVIETNDYYPYGMLMNGGATSVQPFKYSGKELDRMHGLNWYDHGARMSDPALCRWHVVDPLCEKYYDVSPYVVCANDPVNFVDRDGRFATKWGAAVSRFISCAHLQNVEPIQYNPDATNPNYRYTYNTYSYENGDYVVTAHHKMSKNFAESMQDVGDVLSYAGYGLTLSVVGAEIGIPMAEVLHLRNVFKLVVNGFYDGSFPEQQSV